MNKDTLAVNALRALSLDMICHAKSGHPGIALSAAPLLYALYKDHLNAAPSDSSWIDRDRFVLSAGHASALLYALLHLAGYPIPMDQLKAFRKIDSLTPGHPEFGHTAGIDCTAGPLGQGIAQATGLALAERHLRALYPEGERLFDHYTYCLVGDGCLEEGISQEAISFAGIQKLNRLIVLYDRNDCTLDGPLSDSSVENVSLRFEAAGWNVLDVKDGNDVESISKAIALAKNAKSKPTLIVCHTVIGYGSPYAGSHKSHGKAFSPEEVLQTKKNLGYPYGEFEIPQEVYDIFRETFAERGEKRLAAYKSGLALYRKDHPESYLQYEKYLHSDVSHDLFKAAPVYPEGFKEASRDTSQSLLELLYQSIPVLVGGSADVADSVKTRIPGLQDMTPEHPEGKNIRFGIREFAMASIANGILLHGGLRTYVGSFLVFADYMKSAIRMSALERLPLVYLFSHDSIAVGEDGPTHEPIEQLTMLRTIPGVDVYRPCDSRECAASYRLAFANTANPSAIILSRQALPLERLSSFDAVGKGAYVLEKEEKSQPDLVLVASGSEVPLAVETRKLLLEKGIDCRVVSMPCTSLFDRQDKSYQDDVLGKDYGRRVYIEMGKGDMLYKYAAHVLSIDTYGKSGSLSTLLEDFGFTPEKVAEKLLAILETR